MSKKNEPWHFKYLRSRITEMWNWYPPRKLARDRARQPNGSFKCAHCKRGWARDEVEIDHIVPREGLQGWDGWDAFIERTFCPVTHLQVLCKACHTSKSKVENNIRRAWVKYNAGTKQKAKNTK